MRTLIVALGLAALATSPALAQNVSRGSTSASSGTTTATGTTTTTAGTTTSTTGSATSTNGSAFVALPGGTATDPGLSAAPSSSSGTTTSSSLPASSSPANTTNDIHAATPGSSFAPGGPFSNDSGNTALGTSPGQTSSGTFAGNSSTGIGSDSSSLNGNVGNTGTVTLVPEGAVSVIGGGSTGARVVGVPNAVSPQGTAPGTATSTPLFDQAAREGRAREARRRAQGNEPRVYGIAPNTERDLTWQMPDDKIIRY